MDYKKMFKKVLDDAVKTTVAGAMTGGVMLAAPGVEMNLQNVAGALGTAFVSAVITGIFNYRKHKGKKVA